jgi:transcriptional regulator with XRE-family HTH domain
MNEDEHSVGARLQAWIEATGYTKAEFAEKVGVRPNQITRWTTGEHSMRVTFLETIVRALGISTDTFLFGDPPKIDYSRFAENLRKTLEARGMQQTGLAEEMGVSAVSVGRWVRGKQTPNLPQIRRIANALGVSVESLLGQSLPSLTQERNAFPTEYPKERTEARQRLALFLMEKRGSFTYEEGAALHALILQNEGFVPAMGNESFFIRFLEFYRGEIK